MKRLRLPLLLLMVPVQAQEIECPKFYPSEDTVLAEVPYRHRGTGVISKADLSGASGMGSPPSFKPPIEFRGGLVKKVKGGTEIEMPLDTKWFVCYYGIGTTIAWWEELKHDPDKVETCTLKIRNKIGNTPMAIRFVCK